MGQFAYFRNLLKALLIYSAVVAVYSAWAVEEMTCQQYLMKAPVEAQCGPTCTVYSFKNFLEGMIQMKLSSEYALLAVVAMDLRARDEALSGRGFDPEKYRLMPMMPQEAIYGVDPLIAFANYGIHFAADFPLNRAARIFRSHFRRDFNEVSILKVHRQAIEHMNAAILAARTGDLIGAAKALRKYRVEANHFRKYVDRFKGPALMRWLMFFSQINFEVSITPSSAVPGDYEGFLKGLLQKHLPDPNMVSVRSLTIEEFRARIIQEIVDGRLVMIAGREHQLDEGHALLAFGYYNDPSPVVIVRDSSPNKKDPSVGVMHGIGLQDIGVFHNFAITVQNKRAP